MDLCAGILWRSCSWLLRAVATRGAELTRQPAVPMSQRRKARTVSHRHKRFAPRHRHPTHFATRIIFTLLWWLSWSWRCGWRRLLDIGVFSQGNADSGIGIVIHRVESQEDGLAQDPHVAKIR